MEQQTPIVCIGTPVDVGGHSAKVAGIEHTGVRLAIDGQTHQPVVPFAMIEHALTSQPGEENTATT